MSEAAINTSNTVTVTVTAFILKLSFDVKGMNIRLLAAWEVKSGL